MIHSGGDARHIVPQSPAKTAGSASRAGGSRDTALGATATATSTSSSSGAPLDVAKGFLLKRKDFLGVDAEAGSHPNRTYYYRKASDMRKVIEACTRKLQVHI